jgi:trans-2,3-dihydro-3-hydroxyanthranilate isomerase
LVREGARIVFGWMKQPLPTNAPFGKTQELLAALGVNDSTLPVELYSNGPQHLFVELPDPAAVAHLRPDMNRLAQLVDAGVSTFARTETGWKTRVFAPAHGVPEDAATGSAAGPLALHLCRHGRAAFGQEIQIEQGAEIGRPSRLFARIHGDVHTVTAVEVGGSAVVLGRGEIQLP